MHVLYENKYEKCIVLYNVLYLVLDFYYVYSIVSE